MTPKPDSKKGTPVKAATPKGSNRQAQKSAQKKVDESKLKKETPKKENKKDDKNKKGVKKDEKPKFHALELGVGELPVAEITAPQYAEPKHHKSENKDDLHKKKEKAHEKKHHESEPEAPKKPKHAHQSGTPIIIHSYGYPIGSAAHLLSQQTPVGKTGVNENIVVQQPISEQNADAARSPIDPKKSLEQNAFSGQSATKTDNEPDGGLKPYVPGTTPENPYAPAPGAGAPAPYKSPSGNNEAPQSIYMAPGGGGVKEMYAVDFKVGQAGASGTPVGVPSPYEQKSKGPSGEQGAQSVYFKNA